MRRPKRRELIVLGGAFVVATAVVLSLMFLHDSSPKPAEPRRLTAADLRDAIVTLRERPYEDLARQTELRTAPGPEFDRLRQQLVAAAMDGTAPPPPVVLRQEERETGSSYRPTLLYVFGGVVAIGLGGLLLHGVRKRRRMT
jgi:hypothetical protein